MLKRNNASENLFTCPATDYARWAICGWKKGQHADGQSFDFLGAKVSLRHLGDTAEELSRDIYKCHETCRQDTNASLRRDNDKLEGYGARQTKRENLYP